MKRSDPFDEIERMFERMSRQFDEMGGFEHPARGARPFAVDVSEYDDEIVVVADLPGFEREDVDVSVSGRTLTVAADRESSVDDETGGEYRRRERRSESASRSIGLPADVDESGATATYRNGVLTVTLPKERVDDASRIDVE